MANTPRQGPAYIVFGAKPLADGTMRLEGIEEHLDDNIFQQCLESTVHPHPHCQYEIHQQGGKSFGILVVDANKSVGPFVAKEDVLGAGLRRNVLYLRRGSKNAEASTEEQKLIHNWFSEKPIVVDNEETGDPWGLFLKIANPTVPGRQYILMLAHPMELETALLQHLAVGDWNFVVDFDPKSDESGALAHVSPMLSLRRAIHRVTRGEHIQGDLNRGTAWYFARGIAGRSSTLSESGYSAWNKAFGADLREKLVTLARGSAEPVVVVALLGDSSLNRFVQKALGIAGEVFGERLVVALVAADTEEAKPLAEEVDGECIACAPRHFLEGLVSLRRLSVSTNSDVIMPGCDGVPKVIAPEARG